MASGRIQKLRQLHKILVSCAIILSGILLIVACVGIYLSGDQPFSRESVAAAFSPIAAPIYICLALVVLECVLNQILPIPATKHAGTKQLSTERNRIFTRADLDSCDSDLRQQILALQARRKTHARICMAVLLICGVTFLIYALDSSHFHHSDINGSMVHAMWILLPCLGISFVASVLTVYARNKSFRHEIDLLKQCPKKAAAKVSVKSNHSNKLKFALIFVAITLVLFGFFTGGTADVLTKAVNICTECIGLG